MREARSFSLFFLPAALPTVTSAWQPQVDIYRSRDGWVVKLELAGVQPQDVSITIHGSQLRVKGVRHDGSVAAGWRHYAMEIAYNRFERTIDLPCDLQHARITVEYHDRMLLVNALGYEQLLPSNMSTCPQS